MPVFGCLAAGFVCLAAALADVPFGAAGLALAGALVFVGAFALAGALVFAEALAFRGRAAVAGALAFFSALATALVGLADSASPPSSPGSLAAVAFNAASIAASSGGATGWNGIPSLRISDCASNGARSFTSVLSKKQ